MIRRSAVDEIVQHIDILTHVSAGMSDESMRTIVVVIRGVWSHGNNGLQSFNTRRGGRQRNRAVVRRSRHADLASAPERFDFFVLVRRREAFCSAVQPIDDGFWSQ